MALAAYVLGGPIVEKHFTLNRALRGSDHAFSLEPSAREDGPRSRSARMLRWATGPKQMYPVEVEPR